ncbi:MAG TPA: glycosyltransferase family 39 protein [Ktedonobacteraceae bacterium]|nr:glycosyltransferase family 39 protein [Ktedonobacteraceae bacterium]
MGLPDIPPATLLPKHKRRIYWPRRAIQQIYRSENSRQFLRFGLVGCLNTLIDLLALNCLLRLLPIQDTDMLILINSAAYILGATNSFILNRYWTFRHRGSPDIREVWRFGMTTLGGMICNDLMLAGLNRAFSAFHLSTPLWTNIAKFAAIAGTVLISYLGMRLWVFVHQAPSEEKQHPQIALREETSKNMIDRFGVSYTKTGGSHLPVEFWHRLALGAIMLIALFANFYQLGQNGFGNLFYAAGVRSMTDSLHNFFFVSYDPGGFVTIDKPPLGFWLQAISVKLFGFTPFSIFFPQALSGLLAVLILFLLVRRRFGAASGLLAALALAISPLSVVTNRNNTIDSTLTLVLLLGAWAILLATETGKWRWLLLSAVLIGLGFNIKMLEAYLVVPAFGLLYLLSAPRSRRMRIWQLAVTALVLLAVSLSWAITVDLTSASQRPYVGSSPDNSAISLALGYNGLDRLIGRGGRNDRTSQTASQSSVTGNNVGNAIGSEDTFLAEGTTPNNPGQRVNSNFRGFSTGSPGPLRLLASPLGGQIAWLLPIALLGLIAGAWQRRLRFRDDPQQQALLLWGGWLFTMGAFFSIAGFFHQYYMTTLAPAICALFGIGLGMMWQDYRQVGWRGWLLPLALLLTAGEQIYLLSSNPAWGSWLVPVIALFCILAAIILIGARWLTHMAMSQRILLPSLSIGIAVLLLTPAIWSMMPGLQNSAGSTPVAGPTSTRDVRNFGRTNNTTDAALIHYLEENRGNAKFLVATINSMSANGIILATNKPVMAMGGFSGRDPILTRNELSSLVANGVVRFFLLNTTTRLPQSTNNTGTQSQTKNVQASMPAGSFNFFGRNAQNPLTSWVAQHCSPVPSAAWQSSTSKNSRNPTQLYDCAQTK